LVTEADIELKNTTRKVMGSIPYGVIGHTSRYGTKKIQAGRSWIRFPIVSLDTEADNIEIKKYT
jgi:hypothetical protein